RVPTRNWSGEVRFDPARAVAPADEQQVLAVLADARRTGRTVRVIGAGHSFTPLARTDGILLSLDHLQGVVAADVETGLVTLRGGTRLWRIAELLAPH
ncbi:MAG: FAD-binding protein, partial [Brachybacterium sp.]|nr:FAD-binding protein [Brachybacterium sp.]